MSRRGDFSASTVRLLRERAGNVCSICGIGTSGAQLEGPGSVSIGVAAHITAAAVGGPRYDASSSPEQRSHADNGIWLCQIHARQIDVDAASFTVAALRTYKQKAEQRSARDIMTLTRRPDREQSPLSPEDTGALAALGVAEHDCRARLEPLRAAAGRDLQAFRRQFKVVDRPAVLRLQLLDGDRSSSATEDEPPRRCSPTFCRGRAERDRVKRIGSLSRRRGDSTDPRRNTSEAAKEAAKALVGR